MPYWRMRAFWWTAAAIVLVVLVGWDFVAATTFLGDDHVFRHFARFEANPLVAFVVDKHGGEYYRPIPMLLWWVIERTSGGQAWAFALFAFALHLLCAALLGLVGRASGLPGRTALVAGVLFFATPAQREAALWFSASTDVLAAAFALGSMACFLSGRRGWRAASVVLAAAAFFCKETALVLPLLLLAARRLRAGEPAIPMRRSLLAVIPHVATALLYLASRFMVLRGLGGTNDALAPWWGRGLQLASGLVHSLTAYAPLPEWVAWLAGVPALAWIALVAFRQRPRAAFAALWVAVTLLPLPAAGWVVGARYFYMPAAGLMLLLALALESAGALTSLFVLAALLGLGIASGGHRAGEVRLYRQAVAAAGAAVAEGVAAGHRIFLVRGGVKDLDLAVKLDRGLPAAVRNAVVIPDVPASFVSLPADLAPRLGFLLAQPPLPPSGAYRFGTARLAGLARREEAPDLEEVLLRLPEIRIIALRNDGGRYTWQDRTRAYARKE